MLSICTPTFNRAHTLSRLYESLKNQEVMNFEWIIIDDGSTDYTQKLVETFKNEGIIPIKYLYQKNSGKHIALNKGQWLASKELFTCVDSDDWLSKDATAMVNEYYKKIKKKENLVGLIFLDKYSDEQIIGTEIPHEHSVNWINLVHTLGMRGDKCYIFKTNIIKMIPFPYFKNNNHMPPSYQLYLLSKNYNFYCVNSSIKYVEYLDDGISKNITNKYFSAPANYTYYRKSIHNLLPTFSSKLKNSIHYNITKQIAGSHPDLSINNVSQRFFNLAVLPLSFILLKYYKIKNRR